MIEIEECIFIDAVEGISKDITNLWLTKGWDDNQLSSYIIQRFGRPIEQLSPAELRMIKDELFK